MFSPIDLRLQVPPYAKEQDNWGGPACCQMAMNGYPVYSSKQYFKQSSIANIIQGHNKEKLVWNSDPYGVTTTLNSLNKPPSNGLWIDVSGTPKEAVLHTLLCWMANYKYPSLLCPQEADHWIILVYFDTVDDPRLVANTTLNFLGYYDPDPVTGGLTFAPGDLVWWSDYLGSSPCPDGQIWKNKFVGIGEPPEKQGSIKVDMVVRTGKKLIEPRIASENARRFLTEWSQKESDLSMIQLGRITPAQPMLVKDLSAQEESREDNPAGYYAVPFVQRYNTDETGTPLAWLTILVNAYTGRFEGLHRFNQPVRYLSKKEAVKIASASLRLNLKETEKMDVELVFSPLRGYVSSALPCWKASIQGRSLFVTQQGTAVGALLKPSLLGA